MKVRGPVKLPINFPVAGMSEIGPFAKQPANTSPFLLNVRAYDAKTGRLRGGQRAGTSWYETLGDQVNGNNKVQRLTQVTFPKNTVTYGNPSTGVPPTLPVANVDWSAAGGTGKPIYNIKQDIIGNTYELTGNGTVTKRNSKGQGVLTFSAPLADSQHVCRSLAVDSQFNVYIGVTYGGDQALSRIWKFAQKPELSDDTVLEVATLAWEFVTGRFIGDMAAVDGCLYTAENDDAQHKTWVFSYNNLLNSAEPDVLWRSKAAWPAYGLAVYPGQAVLVTSPFADGTAGTPGDRRINPTDPNVGYVTYQGTWNPTNLVDYKKRAWGWWDAERIDGGDFFTDEYEQGDDILRVVDLTGNGRDLVEDFFHAPAGGAGTGTVFNSPPKYNIADVAGKPTIGFAGGEITAGDGSGYAQGLISGPNASWDAGGKNQQLTALPSYNGAGAGEGMFVVFAVVRGMTNTASGKVGMQGLISEKNANLGAQYRGIVFNGATADPGGAGAKVWTAAATNNNITVWDYSSTATVANHPNYTGYDGSPVLLSWICDGNKGSIAAATDTASLFRVNGQQIGDRWKSNTVLAGILETMIASRGDIAHAFWIALSEFFGGALCEMFVMRDNGTNTDVSIQGKLLSHPTVAYGGVMTYAGTAAASPTEMEQIEGYFAHKWGIQGKLNATHPFATLAPLPTSTSVNVNAINSTKPQLVKYALATGAMLLTKIAAGAADYYGYGIAVTPALDFAKAGYTNYFYVATCGNDSAGFGGISLNADIGGTTLTNLANLNYDGIFEAFTDTYMRMDVDAWGNAFCPVHNTVTAVAANRMLLVVNIGGISKITAWGLDITNPFTANQGCYAVCVPKAKLDFTGGTAVNLAEYCVIGLDSSTYGGTTNQDTVKRLRLVDKTPNSNPPRQTTLLGVAGGAIKKITTGAITAPAVGTNALASTAGYVSSAVFNDEAFFCDGKSSVAYTAKTDTLSEFVATSSGELPKGMQLMAEWRNRLVAVGSDRYIWAMSKSGDARNWNFYPPVFTANAAIDGSTPNGPGRCPDIINTIIPYSENKLIFGCDSSIWLLVALDPGTAAFGLQFVLLSDVTGMSYGRPWCKDPEGRIYFYGSRGDVWRISPGSLPENISGDKLPQRLRDLNLAQYYVELVWNDTDDGVHVLVCPFGSGGTVVDHFFWQRQTEGWFIDRFGLGSGTEPQPTCAFVSDGDNTTDRVLLFGCEDGRVRKWDKAVAYDAGTTAGDQRPIATVATIRVSPDGAGDVYKFSRFTVNLSPSQDGCDFRLLSSRVAEPPLDVDGNFQDDPTVWQVIDGQLDPGPNPPRGRMKGAYCWLQLRSAIAGKRWAFESADIVAEVVGGKARV